MFKYFGAKQKSIYLYDKPIFDTIIEPFAGSASYAVAYRHQARRVILVEKDARIVSLWNRLLKTKVSDLLSIKPPKQGERCSDLLVALAAGRTTGDTPENFIVSPRMEQRFRPMVCRIADVLDECRYFEIILGDYTAAPDIEATWFVDPPYQYRGGRQDRTRGGRYAHSNKDLDYTCLGAWCRERSGQVMVCEQEGADWLPWQQALRMQNGVRVKYNEVVWSSMTKEKVGFLF